MHRSFIEVRQSKQRRRDQQRCQTAHAAFEQILHPAAKEKFFGQGGEEKYQQPSQSRRAQIRCVGVRMDKTEGPSQAQHQRREEDELAQSALPVAPAQVKVETGSAELTDGKKTIQRS